MIKHYDGVLGMFNYDDEMFEVVEDSDDTVNQGTPEYLHYIGNGYSVELPNGCINTNRMFYGCWLSEGFSLGESFNTSSVVDTDSMFCDCELPEGFVPDDSLDLSKFKELTQLLDGTVETVDEPMTMMAFF